MYRVLMMVMAAVLVVSNGAAEVDGTGEAAAAAATRLWMTHYGRVRQTRTERAHKGLPQAKRTVDGSEAAYIRARAAITASLIGPAGDLLPNRTDLVADDWAPTPSQAREIEFNENKVKTAKVEALLKAEPLGAGCTAGTPAAMAPQSRPAEAPADSCGAGPAPPSHPHRQSGRAQVFDTRTPCPLQDH